MPTWWQSGFRQRQLRESSLHGQARQLRAKHCPLLTPPHVHSLAQLNELQCWHRTAANAQNNGFKREATGVIVIFLVASLILCQNGAMLMKHWMIQWLDPSQSKHYTFITAWQQYSTKGSRVVSTTHYHVTSAAARTWRGSKALNWVSASAWSVFQVSIIESSKAVCSRKSTSK